MNEACSPSATRDGRIILACALVYAAFIFALLPPGIVVLNDDFGYLKSVVQTLQHGRVWTDDWLEPWAASLSGLVAIGYTLTGKFYLSAYCLVALSGGASFGLLAILLRRRECSIGMAVGTAAFVCTFPTLLWKSLEFTGMVVYLPCFFLALWSAETRRWWLFALAWLLAVTSRQSALAWLALPSFEAVRIILRTRTGLRRAIEPALLVAGGVFFFWWFGRYMNKTHSQLMLTAHVLENIQTSAVIRAVVAGALAYLAAAGWGSVLLHCSKHGPEMPSRSRRSFWVISLAGAMLWLLVSRYGGNWVLAEHLSFANTPGRVLVGTLLALSFVGWLLGGVKWSIEKITCAAACLAVLALREDLWDYYFIDLAILGFLGVQPRTATTLNAPSRWRWATVALSILAASLQSYSIWEFKLIFDRAYADNRLAERALRAGAIGAHELGFTPFGMRGWYLHEYHITHEGRTDRNIASLQRYLKWRSLGVAAQNRGLRFLHSDTTILPNYDVPVLGTESCSFGWIFRVDYALLRLRPFNDPEQPTPELNPHDFDPPSFPLTDGEWTELIKGRPKEIAKETTISFETLSVRQRSLFRFMQPRPVRLYSSFGPALWQEDRAGDEQFSIHPNTRLWFALSGGSHHLTTSFELLPGSYDGVAKADATDGIELTITTVAAQGHRNIIFQRLLNPRDTAADRGRQPINCSFDLPSDGGEVELSVNSGRAGSNARDWAVLYALHID